MPCQSDWSESDIRNSYQSDINALKKEADAATRAACDMRTILRRVGLQFELTHETQEWIKKHDAADAARIAKETASGLREQTKRNALNKLTLEERRVLGL